MIHKASARVKQMEEYFDILQKTADENPGALREDESVREMLDALIMYYESGQWLKDFELDEKGIFPQNLKRGVLSEDGIYNFLSSIDR